MKTCLTDTTLLKLKKFAGLFTTLTLLLLAVGPIQTPAFAVIDAGDYFTLTAAGDATTMDSGGTLVFTIAAKDSLNAANTLAGSDYAYVEIVSSSNFAPSTAVDITAVGAGLSLSASGNGATPYPLFGFDVSGTNDNVIKFNIADGTSVNNTFTVKATESFEVFVYAPDAAVNEPVDSKGGQDFQSITVGAGSGSADHLVATLSKASPAVNEEVTVTVTQVNSGGGLDTAALADAVLDVGGYSYSGSGESLVIQSSADHGLVVGDIVKFSTGASNTTAYYVVASAPTSTTFTLVGNTSNTLTSTSKITPHTDSGAGLADTMSGTPGFIFANMGSSITVSANVNVAAGNLVAIAGCAGHYIVTSAFGGFVNVIGPNACNAPTPSGAITVRTTNAGVESASTLKNGSIYISEIGGVDTGVTTTTNSGNQALTNGVTTFKVVSTAASKSYTIAPSSVTLGGTDVNATFTASTVSSVDINAYSPPNGELTAPINARVDVLFSNNPDLAGTAFPMTNTAVSNLSITAGGTAVAGTWQLFTESFGIGTAYRAGFISTAPELTASTAYVVAIDKGLASSANLFQGMGALIDAGASYDFTFTTGAGGGAFDPNAGFQNGGGFDGALGGEFPPMPWMGYPLAGSTNVPTNAACLTVEFDRAMDATTFTTTNIYLKKVVAGVESDPAGTPALTPSTGTSKNVCISGYTLEASTDYRVYVTRSVKDTTGSAIAGMPSGGGFGFGFDNMGPFNEKFTTGISDRSITATNIGSNIGASATAITGVSPAQRFRISFDKPLNTSTISTSTVTLKKNGSVPVQGSVRYISDQNVIEFVPSVLLDASTNYTLGVSTGVTSITGTAITAYSQLITTDVADITNPVMVFADADNYGIYLQFSEPMDPTEVTNKGNYTLLTCSGQAVNADGIKCADNTTDPTTVSLATGVKVHYNDFDNSVRIEGLTLTPNDGFKISGGMSVTDIAGNMMSFGVDDYRTDIISDAANFAGGQGKSQMGTMGFEDMNMSAMGMNPIFVGPMNKMASATSKYFIDIPLTSAIDTNGTIELTFPAGFNVSGVIKDAQSPMNADFNGPGTGTVTFAAANPSGTANAGAGLDGIGYYTGTQKVVVQLSAATQASDFLHFDLDGIVNSSEPKDFSTSGYTVSIKTKNAAGVLLEAMTSMPFFISASGTKSVGGEITDAGVGLNGVKVYLESPMTGPMETTTANNANGGGKDGEYKFSNLQAGDYMIFTQPNFTVGINKYKGQAWPEQKSVTGTETKNFAVTKQNGTTGATQPVLITGSLNAITNLGFNDSIDVFAGGPNGFTVTTLTRSQLTDHIADPGSNPINLYPDSTGEWMVGIGPAMPNGPAVGKMAEIDWMPAPPTNIFVTSANIGGAAKSSVTFAISTADKSISGKVVDSAGAAISNAEVYAYNPKQQKGNRTQTKQDGTFTLPISEGTYIVGSFLPGMPKVPEVAVLVEGASFYVGGSPTASTGSAGLVPFTLKVPTSSTGITITGRVTDGTNVISGASVMAFRTDGPGFADAVTDGSGNYTLYPPATGTWQVEAHADQYGYLGSKTLTVGTESLTGQNFEPPTLGSIAGTIVDSGASPVSGVMVRAYGSAGFNESKTASDGTYTIKVPYGTWTVEAFIPGTGKMAPLTNVVVDGAEVGNNFTLAASRSVTVSLSSAVSADAFVSFYSSTGLGNSVSIPAGSTSTTVSLQQAVYYINVFIPGVASPTITGAEFNNVNGIPSTDKKVDIDGTGDDITLTLPTMRTLSGQVTAGGVGKNDAWVSVYDTTSKQFMGVFTSNNAAGGGQNGEYSISLPNGTYDVSADKPGYSSAPVLVVVNGANSTGNNFALTANGKTISGTVTDGTSNLSNAHVWAQRRGGGFASAESSDGTFTLSVSDGIWDVYAVAEKYGLSTSQIANTTTANVTGITFSLSALTGNAVLKNPLSKPITPSAGGTVQDTNTGTKVVFPPNALGSGSDSGQITAKETNSVVSTPSGSPIGNKGQSITAKDSSGSPITSLSNDIEISLDVPLADLTTDGITTGDQVDDISIGYWDDSAKNWVASATTIEYYDTNGALIPTDTVEAADTLTIAGVTKITLTTSVDHLTTFAPIAASGGTPPATPAGLAVTAGDTQVTLTWTANAEGDMSSYDIWEANVTEGVATTLTQAECAATCTKTITGLTNGTTYSYQIMSVDSDGNKSAGTAAVEGTPAAAVAAPSSSGGGGGGSAVRVSQKNAQDAAEEIADTDSSAAEEEEGAMSIPKPAAGLTPFEDVTGHWAEEFVADLYKKEIISGYNEKQYGSDNSITRAEFIKIVSNAFGLDQIDPTVAESPFSDVTPNDWYYLYVLSAHKEGIVDGFEDGSFGSNNPITRAEAMKVLLVAAGINAKAGFNTSFVDVPASEWYAPYINYAAQHGIVGGYEDGTFGPNNNLTRAEVAKIVSLMLKARIAEEVMSDVMDLITP